MRGWLRKRVRIRAENALVEDVEKKLLLPPKVTVPLWVPTIKDAPRDPAKLEDMGIFRLRLLAEKLGFLSSHEQMVSWNILPASHKATVIAGLLEKYDRENS